MTTNQFETTAVTVVGKPRMLRANWTIETYQDYFGSQSLFKKMKSTHYHQILKYSETTGLVLVKCRGGHKNTKKWYEVKTTARYQRSSLVTEMTLRRLYNKTTIKFKSLPEAERAYLWVILNRE